MHKPLRSFSRAAASGQNASNAYCELNYGKTCADAQFNRDYLMLTKVSLAATSCWLAVVFGGMKLGIQDLCIFFWGGELYCRFFVIGE